MSLKQQQKQQRFFVEISKCSNWDLNTAQLFSQLLWAVGRETKHHTFSLSLLAIGQIVPSAIFHSDLDGALFFSFSIYSLYNFRLYRVMHTWIYMQITPPHLHTFTRILEHLHKQTQVKNCKMGWDWSKER